MKRGKVKIKIRKLRSLSRLRCGVVGREFNVPWIRSIEV